MVDGISSDLLELRRGHVGRPRPTRRTALSAVRVDGEIAAHDRHFHNRRGSGRIDELGC